MLELKKTGASIQNAVTGLQDKILWVTRSVVKGHFNISYNAARA